MQDWARNRDCIYSEDFTTDLARLGIDQGHYDSEVAPKVDQALYGASDERLDAEYPATLSGVRMLITVPTQEIGSLRIAFTVEDDGNILYLRLDAR